MRKITYRDKFQYWFDNLMSRGPIAMIGLLFVLSVILIVLVSAIVVFTPIGQLSDGTHMSFVEVTWMSMMRTLDAGTMGGDTGNWPFLFSMFAVTLGGVFIVSTLIGVLSNGIQEKVEQLRRGRSFVVEHNHTVILGWSNQVFSIVSELVLANENRQKSCIVILADKDKLEMEDALYDRIADFKTTRLVCRTGNPYIINELAIVNLNDSRSIIVLASETEDADALTLKMILAITNNPNRREKPYHIVAELRDSQNLEVAQLIGRDEVEFIKVDELISHITTQTCRQSGLSTIYTELLDFDGDEIYLIEEPTLVGQTIRQTVFAYEDSTVIGIQFKDGKIQLNPPFTTIVQSGDQIIAISKDDDTVKLSDIIDYRIDPNAIRNIKSKGNGPEKTLILGWNRRALEIIRELDNYVEPGSQVTVVWDKAEDNAQNQLISECARLAHTKLIFLPGDTINRRFLDSLDITSYDHVITLSASDLHDAQKADARSMITLIHLRDIADKSGGTFSIVSEILDIQNRELADVCRADDFIVSDNLISLMMSQLSENKNLAPVFEDLFDPQGSELYLKPAGEYIELGTPVNFYTVLESALRRNEIAVGYRLNARAVDAKESYGVKLNPDKSPLVTFSESDKIIVLAEN